MRRLNPYAFVTLIVFISGCATALPPKEQKDETRQDIQKAVEAVKGTISGEKIRFKYCPICGKHYSSNLSSCPADGVPLKESEE